MSVVVEYPVEIRSYQVDVTRNGAEIGLDGVEGVKDNSLQEPRRVGRMVFGDPSPIGDGDFITRGGFLRMDRPLELFSGILDLLRHEKPLFLHGNGTLSTSPEPAGEEES